MFLTEPGLRDMSRKSFEADVKRKFDTRKKNVEKVKSADFLSMNVYIYYRPVSSGYNTELAAFHQLPDEWKYWMCSEMAQIIGSGLTAHAWIL